MPKIKKTPLTQNQLLRVWTNPNGKVKSATLCEIEGTAIKKIEIEYYNMGKEDFYPEDEDQLDYIMNGITLTRGGN